MSHKWIINRPTTVDDPPIDAGRPAGGRIVEGTFLSRAGCGWWLNIYLRWLTNQPPSPIYIYTQRSGLINWSNTLRWFFIAALSFFHSCLPPFPTLPAVIYLGGFKRGARPPCGASPNGRVTRVLGVKICWMDRDSGWLWHMRDMQKSDSDVENSIHKWRKSKEAPREVWMRRVPPYCFTPHSGPKELLSSWTV